MENGQANAGRDGRNCLVRPNSPARTGTIFSIELTTSRIGNLTRLIHTCTLLKVITTVYIHVCVCVCVFSSHSFWTSSSLDVPAGVTQEEGHTGFFIHLLSAVRALIFLARRIQPFLSLVDREVELCVLTI